MCESLSCIWFFATPWTVAIQASLSMEFSRQEYWSGLPFPSPEELPNPGVEPWSPASQADSLSSALQGTPSKSLSHVWLFVTPWTVATRLFCPQNSPGYSTGVGYHSLLQGIFPTQGSNQVSHIAGGFFSSWATREAHNSTLWMDELVLIRTFGSWGWLLLPSIFMQLCCIPVVHLPIWM